MSVLVKVLGRFEVVVDGAAVPPESWTRRQAARLVQLLALAEGHRLHREQVLEALWPDLPAEPAARRLHKAAHYAREALAVPDAVVLSSSLVSLLPAADLTVDVDLFDAACDRARSAQRRLAAAGAADAEPALREEARRRAEEAAALYHGDVLPDDPYEAWLDAARGPRRQQYLTMLRQAGRWDELARADPANEEAHVRLAHRLATLGDRAGALRQLDLLDRVLREELGTEPGETAARLRATVLALPEADPAQAELPRGQAPTPVPELPVPILGREPELRRIAELLDRSRILTLLGPGGVGKTTVAVEAARRRSEARGAEACFVDLTKVNNPDDVPGLVATELGLQHARSDPEQLLQEALRGRRMVLVLDNFEHVLEAAGLVARLATWSRELEVLSTSRARLHVAHEQILDVAPFAVPQRPEQAAGNDAVALFVHYARASDPDFAAERYLSDVAEICRTVDGLPLAIKLAAGHVRTLPPPLLRTRLDERLRSGAGGPRDAPPRQRTVPATIDWSLELLGTPERQLFRRLGVFAGAARIAAIEEVCAEPGHDVLSALSTLVDQSLVHRVEAADDGEVRFSMLELVRERSRELLRESAEHERLADRHAAHVAAWLEHVERDRWTTLASSWLALVATELPEVRKAHAWAAQRGDLVLAARVCGALGTFWHREGHHIEGRRWVGEVLPQLDRLEEALAARVLVSAAFLHWTLDPVGARAFWEGAVSRFRAVGDDRYLSYCQGLLAGTWIGDEDAYDQAVELCEEAIALGRRLGEGPVVAQSLNVLGELTRVHGDDRRALAAYSEGLDLAMAAGDLAHVAVFRSNLAYLAEHRGDHEEALRLARAALRACWSLGRRMMSAWTVSETAGPLLGLDRPELAARLVGAGTGALEILGVTRHLGDLAEHERVVTGLRARLGAERFEELAAEGAEMTLDEAVALVLSEADAAAGTGDPHRPDGSPLRHGAG